MSVSIEPQVFHAGGKYCMTIRLSTSFSESWTSPPAILKAATRDEALAEAQAQVLALNHTLNGDPAGEVDDRGPHNPGLYALSPGEFHMLRAFKAAGSEYWVPAAQIRQRLTPFYSPFTHWTTSMLHRTASGLARKGLLTKTVRSADGTRYRISGLGLQHVKD